MSDFAHISRIHPDPANARKVFAGLDELAASIRVQGILEPLVVQPRPGKPGQYQIIAGERRYRAAKLARLDEVPVVIRRPGGPLEAAALSLIENLQRQDLTAVEKAEGLKALIRRGWTQAAIARATGLSPGRVSSILALDELDQGTRDRVAAGTVKVGDAMAAVRSVRARSKGGRPRGPVTVQAEHFSAVHPLAGQARVRCELAGHAGRKLGKTRSRAFPGACGECWEAEIRADQQARDRAPGSGGSAGAVSFLAPSC